VRKSFVASMLFAALLFQGFATAAGGLALHSADGVAHAALHWHDVGHHHHDDGSVHEEQSEESRAHLQADSALLVVALPSAPQAAAAHPLSPQPARAGACFLAASFLAGLTRPPRLAA
jgi:hypothetical protein